MRKVSIALRRMGGSDFPNMTRAEKRAMQREPDPLSDDLDDFLKDMQKVDEKSPDSDSLSESNGGTELFQGSDVAGRFQVQSPTSKSVSLGDLGSEDVPPSPSGYESGPGSNEDSQPTVIEMTRDAPPPIDELGEVVLYSRRESEDGFSATFKLKRNGGEASNGELRVYSHTSEAQLSGLGDSPDSVFAVGVPAASSVRLGPNGTSKGWEHLSLKGPDDGTDSDDLRGEEESLPRLPVPDGVPGSLWAVPVELFAATRTRIAFTNATDQPLVVQLYLLDAKGNKIAGTFNQKLNPLPPHQQVLDLVDRYFPELKGLAEFYGTIVVRVEREGHIWAMGVIGDDPENLTIRRALNMNVDLEGLKDKMAKELEEISVREAALQEQMAHLDAVLNLAAGNGDTGRSAMAGTFTPSPRISPESDFTEASGS
ncbi:MAG: hypothetical protein ACWGQW_19960 [bacterium]